jgi:thiosulfate dehydrogenase
MKRLILTLAVLAAISCGCADETNRPTVEHGTAIDHGQAIFDDPGIAGTELNAYSCATCHEEGPADDGVLRPGGALAGVTERPSYWAGQEPELLRAVNDCLYYFMLKDTPWAAEDEEARALYGYLESISKDAEGTAAAPFTVVASIGDLTPGDAARGASQYDRACGTCHGPAHTGDGRLVERAPVLPEQTLEEHPIGKYTAEDQRLVFVEKVRHGGFLSYTGQMPPFSTEKLPAADLADILQYLGLYKTP